MSAESYGILLIVSGPSGVGKGTVCKRLREINENVCLAVSATTRLPRPQEINGVHYHFIKMDEFIAKKAAGEFLEWAEVYGNYYGTLVSAVNEKLQAGFDVILEIDTQGARQIRQVCPAGVYIYLLPPSLDELKRRIIARATESADMLGLRLSKAEFEMSLAVEYDYRVTNHSVDEAAEELAKILAGEKQRRLEVEEKC